MTHEEAIELIRSTPLYRHDKENGRQSDLFKALDLAIEAITKQIPKKLEKVDVQPYFRKHYSNNFVCPVCHNRVNANMNHCEHCGQRLE